MTNKDRIQDIYQMMNAGKALDAFDQYYDEKVVMIEGDGNRRVGKATNREYEENFFAGIKEIHDGGTPFITADEDHNVTMVETWMDVTFKDGNRMKMEQIARQKWNSGKIIEERFYYNA